MIQLLHTSSSPISLRTWGFQTTIYTVNLSVCREAPTYMAAFRGYRNGGHVSFLGHILSMIFTFERRLHCHSRDVIGPTMRDLSGVVKV